MTMVRADYPPNWKEITQRIRDRAGNKCEQCGIPNGVEYVRSSIDPVRYMYHDADQDVWIVNGEWVRLSEIPSEFEEGYADDKPHFIVLTVHHLGIAKPDGTPGSRHDKMDVRDENLIALCQRCHLLADLDIHQEKARLTRARKHRQKLIDLGQLELPFEVE